MRNAPWLDFMKLGFESWSLATEAAAVIGLRGFVVARGGTAAASETQLMLSEKIAAALEWQMAFLFGRLGSNPVGAMRKTVAFYGRKVQSNRRRLG